MRFTEIFISEILISTQAVLISCALLNLYGEAALLIDSKEQMRITDLKNKKNKKNECSKFHVLSCHCVFKM